MKLQLANALGKYQNFEQDPDLGVTGTTEFGAELVFLEKVV